MKCLNLITVLICLLSFVGCATRKATRYVGPDLGAALARSQGITETISLAEGDSKEIKRAILSLQESNKVLHKLNGEAVLILDRADYKTRKLLEKP
jgi:uncharacterized lipoprotein YajG